ncbi:MAG: hypothetical protein ACTHVE_07235 [Senegalia sp. (in: firmicutes)]|uniref:hypothetical protein n=1 Tax=Senegalia sp. (in: firmicutes) TaxID=1924098 RepID=UPI003F957081
MDKNDKDIEQKYIIDTNNKNKFPIIENKINANVFPLDMKRDVDYIDPSKFK